MPRDVEEEKNTWVSKQSLWDLFTPEEQDEYFWLKVNYFASASQFVVLNFDSLTATERVACSLVYL